MKQEDVYSLTEKYDFSCWEDGITIALFAILKELQTLNKTLKQKEKQ